MPKRRKEGNKFTTISVSWSDKEVMRKFAKFKTETKTGKLYESDAEVFSNMLAQYSMINHDSIAHPTYPTILQGKPQHD